jgi:hypothetical protein
VRTWIEGERVSVHLAADLKSTNRFDQLLLNTTTTRPQGEKARTKAASKALTVMAPQSMNSKRLSLLGTV